MLWLLIFRSSVFIIEKYFCVFGCISPHYSGKSKFKICWPIFESSCWCKTLCQIKSVRARRDKEMFSIPKKKCSKHFCNVSHSGMFFSPNFPPIIGQIVKITNFLNEIAELFNFCHDFCSLVSKEIFFFWYNIVWKLVL